MIDAVIGTVGAAIPEVNQMAEYISTSEAAERLRVSPRTIARWIRRGCFPGAIKVNPNFKNSPFIIPIPAIEEFEKKRELITDEDEDNK